jgi:carbon-monoxide dehydrogenase small subunit
MWENHSFQCGFCTPGFLMQITELLRDNSSPTELEVREALSGNVCRCTGYETIVNGVLAAAGNLGSGAQDPDH